MNFQKTPIAILIAAAFMVGCGGSNTPEQVDPLSIEAYPLLQKYYGLDQDDLDRIANLTSQLMAQKTTKQTLVQGVQGSQDDEYAISLEKVKNAVLGAAVFIENSSFNNFPIFDIGLLTTEGLFQKNTASMNESSSIEMKTITTGESDSYAFKARAAVSFSSIGPHAQIAAEGEKNFKEIRNKGGSSVVFRRQVSSNEPTLQLTTKLGAKELDYTPFLVGTAFTKEQMAQIIKITKCPTAKGDPAGGYICKVDPDGLQLSSIPANNPLQQIQILSELIGTFDTLRTQRSALLSNDTRRAEMLNSMVVVRDAIRREIEDFYASHGQAFISALYTMGDAVGVGTIRWQNTTGNESTRWATSVSAGYSTFVAAGQAELDLSGLSDKGWAESFKNVTVNATSSPVGFASNIDTWAQTITNMLKDAGNSQPQVPTADLKNLPFVKLPEPAKLKEPMLPPKGTYSNLREWVTAKEYLKDPVKNKALIENAEEEVKQNFVNKAQAEQPVQAVRALKSTAAVSDGAAVALDYSKLKAEIDQFNDLQKNLMSLRTGLRASPNNMVSFDGHFVSGFDVTKYEDVLPQLRPNLTIEGEKTEAAEYYPNATRMRMLASRVQDAAVYIRFLSNIEDISGINSQMADKFQAFSKAFSNRVFDKLKLMTVAGKDIASDVVEKVIDESVGNFADETKRKESPLYQLADNEDLYRYFRESILTPKAAQIWAEGSGGYIPFTFQGNTQSNGMTFVDVRGIKYNEGNNPEIDSALNISFFNPESNPMSFYRDRALYPDMKSLPLQSPWYPVFRYNGSNESTLLYVQFVGADRIIYGKQYVIVPTSQDLKSYQFKSVPVNPNARLSPQMKALMSNPYNSFSKDEGIRFPVLGGYKNFSIKFPNSTPSSSLHERYQMLLMPVNQWTTQQRPVTQAPDNGYHALPWNAGLRSFSAPSSSDVPYLLNSSLQSVNACNSIVPIVDLCRQNGKLIALLPISKQSIREDFQTSFRWGASYKLNEMIRQSDYEVINSIKYLHMKVE